MLLLLSHSSTTFHTFETAMNVFVNNLRPDLCFRFSLQSRMNSVISGLWIFSEGKKKTKKKQHINKLYESQSFS